MTAHIWLVGAKHAARHLLASHLPAPGLAAAAPKGRGRAWIPPDGLDRSRPREVRLTGAGKALVALAACLWIAALAAAIVLGFTVLDQAEELGLFRRQAVSTQGEVARLWRARGESKQPWMAYRFVVQGRTYERQVKLRLNTWRTLREGSHVSLRYLPSNPNVSYLGDSEPRPLPAVVPYLAGLGLGTGGWLVLLPLQGQRRLLSEGRAAPARVTRHSKEEHGTAAHFQFALLSGATREGKSGPTSKPPAVGQMVCVVYDPENPRQHAVYPFSLVRTVYQRSL